MTYLIGATLLGDAATAEERWGRDKPGASAREISHWLYQQRTMDSDPDFASSRSRLNSDVSSLQAYTYKQFCFSFFSLKFIVNNFSTVNAANLIAVGNLSPQPESSGREYKGEARTPNPQGRNLVAE